MARPVELKVYDLSGGLAKSLSLALIGKEIEGIWHTGVVVDGIEYFFGQGIQRCPQHCSPFGTPCRTLMLGETEIPDDMINDFIDDVTPKFNAATYDLLSNNCNTFADALCDFLTGHGIPDYILGLPQEVLSAPGGKALLQIVQPMMQQRFSSATASGFAEPPSPTGPQTSAQPAEGKAMLAPSGTDPPVVDNRSASDQQTSPVLNDVQHPPGGKEDYKAALNREFLNARERGIQDANAAAATAIRRVAELVQSGAVMPPQAQLASGIPDMAKE